MKLTKFKNVIALSMVTVLLAGSPAIAGSTSTVWKEAPVNYYNASKTYPNDYYDGYSFIIKKLCKTGTKTDNSDYKTLNMELTVTNTNKMRLHDNQSNVENWKLTFKADKATDKNNYKSYSYLIVDKKGYSQTYKTGLNSRIKSTKSKAMNTQIEHKIY